ncbi:MAG: hypothetical protein IPL23_13380 [Saprospiraceae bacterium]|nr:hypothetical protein [Saprospiraceae bacterium]
MRHTTVDFELKSNLSPLSANKWYFNVNNQYFEVTYIIDGDILCSPI